MTQKKLFLLDGFALIYRAYFAFIKNPRVNSKGLNTSAPFGFTNTLNDIIKNQKPDHIAVVLDPPGGTFRNELYPEYKAHREAMPEDLRASIPWVIKIIEAFNIPCITIDNYEADDVVGTLAKQAAEEDFEVFMMTLDKDYCQLVDENIKLYKPKSFGSGIDILDIEGVKAKFSVETPLQVIDILGLWGDSSDNVPGAPGIGEKRAKELIAKYGSIEGVYDHIDELKGKQKENLQNFKEQVLLSKDLVTIRTDVPVEFDAAATELTQPDAAKLEALFRELEFGGLSSRILQKPIAPQSNGGQLSLFDTPEESVQPEPIQPLASMQEVAHDYQLVQDEQALHDLVDLLASSQEFCFDTETTGVDAITADIVGIAFSVEKGKAFYVPMPEDFSEAQNKLQTFKHIFANNALKIAQNLKYDMLILKRYGIEIAGPYFDTMLAHYLLEPEMRHGLDVLAEKYLSYKTQPIEDLIGKKGKLQKSFRTVPLDQAKEYAGEDADITFQLKDIFAKEIEANGLAELFYQIEAPLVAVLAQMEWNGVTINTESLSEFSKELNTEIIAIEQRIYEHAGHPFNIASPKQMGEVLFDEMKIAEKVKKTKTKQYSTSEDTLSGMLSAHPIVSEILEYRSLKKLTSTYIDALPKLINPASGKIHTSYNQAVVATGRLSSVNPNLQNIPIRSSKGKEVRKAFIPSDENHLFLSADYSQIELRLIAHFSEDANFIQAFQNGEDIHTATASKIFSVPLADVTGEQRAQAKGANFGIVYGISAFGLSQNLGISRSEAKDLIDGYFTIYPDVKKFMDSCINQGREKGYVQTLFGRRRYLRDINSRNATMRGWAERNAINAPIQGTGADIVKKAMIDISCEMQNRKLQSQMIMQVHDELNFNVPSTELEEMTQLVQSKMANVVSLSVPLIVQIGAGQNWLQAH